MTWPTHRIINTSTAITTARTQHLPWTATIILATSMYAASTLPDRIEKPFGIRILPHRGPLTHSPILIPPTILLALAVHAPPLARLAALGLAAGYALHLAADACTITGLPAWPLHRNVWLLPRTLRITTGGRGKDRAPRRTRPSAPPRLSRRRASRRRGTRRTRA